MTVKKPPQLIDVLTRTGIAAWSIVGVLALLWVILLVLGRMEVLLAPVVVAVALIYILNPVVNRLSLGGRYRLLGTTVAFLLFTGLLVLIGFLVIPSISDQAAGFTEDFPQIYEDSTQEIEELATSVGITVNIWSYDEVESFVTDPENQDQFFAAAWDRIGAVTSGVFEAVLVFFLAPVVAFYVLIDLPGIRRQVVSLIPGRDRDEVLYVSRELGSAVGGFLRGQLFVALIVGALTSFGFWLIGLDFWLIIGMIAGLLNIVPFLGPWVGGTLGVMVGLVTGSVTTALWAAVVAVVVQQIDNNFISPNVMRATVRLHPAVVILVLILGGALGGVWGVLLAVPLTAAVKIVAGHLWRTRVLGQSWDEAAEAMVEDDVPPEAQAPRRGQREDAAGAVDELDGAADASPAAADPDSVDEGAAPKPTG